MNLFRTKTNRLTCVAVRQRKIALLLGFVAISLMAANAGRSETVPKETAKAGPTKTKTAPTQTVPAEPAATQAVTSAHLIRVSLPLTGMDDVEIMESVDRLLSELPQSGKRPLLVFEFSASDPTTAASSQFERSLALARHLASDRFSRVRTVAFLPQNVEGHAVLPVLACEEIIVAPDAQFGAAGLEDTTIDKTVREAYREIAMRRRTVPVPIVMSMLDREEAVTEVQLVDGGVRYVLADELESIRQRAEIWKERTVVRKGDLGLFTGRQLRLEFGFASHMAASRQELEERLNVRPGTLRGNASSPESWRALRIDLSGHIVTRTANEFVQAIQKSQANDRANLICLVIDSPGGSPAAALRIVSSISELGPDNVRTIAFVGREARSVAALIALACDEVYAAEDCHLGGPGITNLDEGNLSDIKGLVQELSADKGHDWSLFQAMVDPGMSVFRYRREGTGQLRYLGEEERKADADGGNWIREGKLDLSEGISGIEAQRIGLVREHAASLAEVLNRLNIHGTVSVAKPNRAVSAIERLAGQPWFARTLLFVAFFALITEASAPGMGVAGFVSAFCFLLFFWTQFLNGTAGWLEVVLFLGGLACIGLEIIVIPGFGVFGIGGGIMVLVSIVLASQTFVIPRNSYQFDQLPHSLLTMVFAGGGVMTAVWVVRRFFEESPLFRRFMLTPPDEEELDGLEAMVDWKYLEGKRGTTTTQLTPSGKAKFGDEVIDVIADGSVISSRVPVVVVEVRGNHVLVEPLDEG